jgi:hypothetical protein
MLLGSLAPQVVGHRGHSIEYVLKHHAHQDFPGGHAHKGH